MVSHWIWLATRQGLTPRASLALLQAFGDVESIYYARDYSYVEGLRPQNVEPLLDKSLIGANEILGRCSEKGIGVLTYQDSAYPNRLKQIPDPPMVLYYKGRLPEFDGEAAIGVVGTRKASAYGCVTAKRLGFQLAKCGGLVVSGMAGGVDGMAMRGALMGGGFTVGVLGCGVDVIYPRGNLDLYKDTEVRGCLISEYSPGAPPDRWHFPRRNRIISGLSCGVLVVEAPAKSGALITAQQALDQGRDVFAVPGGINTPVCEGSNALLRQGAILARCGWDVLEEYLHLFPDKLRRWDAGQDLDAYTREIVELRQDPVASEEKKQVPALGSREKSIDNGSGKTYDEIYEKQADLTAEEKTVLKLLSEALCHVDRIISDSDLSTSAVLVALTMLEVKGLVVRHPGKYYSRVRAGTGEK